MGIYVDDCIVEPFNFHNEPKMKEKRKFDVLIKVDQNSESKNWKFALTLESEFTDDELPEDFKRFKEGKYIQDESIQQRYVEMAYNFLKNNIDFETKTDN